MATAMIDDLTELAASGGQSSALSNADINTALLQITIQYASTQTLDNAISNFAGGIITDGGDFIAADLKGAPNWHPDIDPEGLSTDHRIRRFPARRRGWAPRQCRRTRPPSFGRGEQWRSGDDQLCLRHVGPGLRRLERRCHPLAGWRGHACSGGRAATSLSAAMAPMCWRRGRRRSDHGRRRWRHADRRRRAGMRSNGGAGPDRFVFTSLNNGAGGDRINGFDPDADRFVIDNDVFTELGNEGPLADNAFFEGAAANDASDRIIYNASTGALFYDADGYRRGSGREDRHARDRSRRSAKTTSASSRFRRSLLSWAVTSPWEGINGWAGQAREAHESFGHLRILPAQPDADLFPVADRPTISWASAAGSTNSNTSTSSTPSTARIRRSWCRASMGRTNSARSRM